MATPTALYEDLAELAFLLGTWSGTGEGVWPPGEPFDYGEDVTFEHVVMHLRGWVGAAPARRYPLAPSVWRSVRGPSVSESCHPRLGA